MLALLTLIEHMRQKMAEVYGYARVSTDEQDTTVQIEALKRAGCTVIRQEKASGSSLEGREELKLLLSFMRSGDTLVVTRIDRLARSNIDFQNVHADLMKRGIKFQCTEQPIMNTDGALGGLMVDILAAFAQFETRLRRERQKEGVKRALDNKEISAKTGRLKYAGGTKRIDRAEVLARKERGENPSVIAREMKIARASVYAIYNEQAAA
jgi:DNA invertase Pin-like site-specific DNA recombinase